MPIDMHPEERTMTGRGAQSLPNDTAVRKFLTQKNTVIQARLHGDRYFCRNALSKKMVVTYQ